MTVPEIPSTNVPLFGGAITADLPRTFADASNFREVPDNQEVYVSMTDDTDISVIIDLCQRVEAASDLAALETHWADVVPSSEAGSHYLRSSDPASVPSLPGRPAYSLVGTVKHRPQDPDATREGLFTALLMTVVRLEEQGTDMVLTVNVPFTKPELVAREGTLAAPGRAPAGRAPGVRSESLDAALQIRDRLMGTLKIVDFGLFAEEP